MENIPELTCTRGVFGLKSWEPLRPPYTWKLQQAVPTKNLPSQCDEDNPIQELIVACDKTKVQQRLNRIESITRVEEVMTKYSRKCLINSLPEDDSLSMQEINVMTCSGDDELLWMERNPVDKVDTIQVQEPTKRPTQCEENCFVREKVDAKLAPTATENVPETNYTCTTNSPPDDDSLSQQGINVITCSGDDELLWMERNTVDKVDTIQVQESTENYEEEDDFVPDKADAEHPLPAHDKVPETTPPTPIPGKRYLCKLCQERMVGHDTFRQHEQGDLHRERVTAYWRRECSVM